MEEVLTTTDHVNEVAGIMIALAAIPAIATAVIYGFGSPWWTSWLGRVMFAKWVSVALVFIVVVARRTWGDYPGYEWVALVVYSFTLLTFTATTIELLIERRGPDDGSVFPTRKEKNMSNPNATPPLAVPDIWYKAQRVLRTVVQTAIPSFLTFALILPQIIMALGLPVESDLYLWLIGLAAGVTAVAAAITRIMAIPGVNEFLVKIGLGSVPARALVATATADGKVRNEVKPDPKAETE